MLSVMSYFDYHNEHESFCTFSLLSLWYKIAGKDLYDSAAKYRVPDLPAFSLECLPNRNSLVYGDLYGIGHEASTVFRGTLRYEGMTLLGFQVKLMLRF